VLARCARHVWIDVCCQGQIRRLMLRPGEPLRPPT
jgi:hypothetical protein